MASGELVNPLLIGYGPYPDMPIQLNPYALGGDPLVGIPARLRFETHNGDKALLPYFFQDTARTVPATAANDPIATMGEADRELVPSQATSGARGWLQFAVDDTPFIDFDGTNDCYPIGTLDGQIVYTCLFRSKTSTWPTFWSLVDQTLGSPGDRFGLFSSGGTQWHNDPFPASVRREEVDLSSPFNMAPIDEWMVTTVVTNNSPNAIARALMQLEGNFFGNAELIAFFIYDGAPSDSQRDRVEAYYETLKPA